MRQDARYGSDNEKQRWGIVDENISPKSIMDAC